MSEDTPTLIARIRTVQSDGYLSATYLGNEHVGDMLGEILDALEAITAERDVLAAGFHLTVQGEPTFTEAQVEAACVAFYEHASGLTSWSRLVEYDAVLAERYRDGIGRALRAAAAAQGGGTR